MSIRCRPPTCSTKVSSRNLSSTAIFHGTHWRSKNCAHWPCRRRKRVPNKQNPRVPEREDKMTLHRREFLQAGAALSLAAALPRGANAQSLAPKPDAWRTFQVTTRVEIATPKGKAQAWIPLPSHDDPDWI